MKQLQLKDVIRKDVKPKTKVVKIVEPDDEVIAPTEDFVIAADVVKDVEEGGDKELDKSNYTCDDDNPGIYQTIEDNPTTTSSFTNICQGQGGGGEGEDIEDNRSTATQLQPDQHQAGPQPRQKGNSKEKGGSRQKERQ